MTLFCLNQTCASAKQFGSFCFFKHLTIRSSTSFWNSMSVCEEYNLVSVSNKIAFGFPLSFADSSIAFAIMSILRVSNASPMTSEYSYQKFAILVNLLSGGIIMYLQIHILLENAIDQHVKSVFASPIFKTQPFVIV